jgi:phage-related protein
MKTKEYIAYKGFQYQIEWFFSENRESQALEYFNELEQGQRIKLLYLLKRMGDIGKINDKTKFMNEGDHIFEFKPQPDRFLCFFEKHGKIIITNAFCKKQQKLPKAEKERALAYKYNYEKRVTEDSYYDR